MSKKFTEEQFNTLVRFQEDQYPDGLYFDAKDYLGSINCTIAHIDDDLQLFIYQNNLYNEAVAIMNPVTRELAHNKYVEKEKKYVWQSKQETSGGEVKRLYNAAIGITDSFMDKTEPTHNGNWITETEVKKWGYNPEMFDKKEA